MKTFFFFGLCLSLLVSRPDPDSPPVSPAILVDTLAGALVLVKGGTFDMGTNEGGSDEQPVHRVTLSDYYLGQYEVTVAQFKTFADATDYRTEAETGDGSYVWKGSSWEKILEVNWRCDAQGNPRPSSDDNHPVIHVSWNDARAYCDWLSRKTGKSYRLPTEAEWEYAAGNGSRHTTYSWGNGAPAGKRGGNVKDETAKSTFLNWIIFEGYTDGFVFTAPVGVFDANDFGLHDMTGNVSEWCTDRDGNYASDNQTNPTGSASGSFRMGRGGSWADNPRGCRVANRDAITPDYRGSALGFRVARAVSF